MLLNATVDAQDRRYRNARDDILVVCRDCRAADRAVGPAMDANYLVDLDRNTVNGGPANINDSSIYWEVRNDKGNTYKAAINRVTGN